MKITETKIEQEDILFLDDPDFNQANICIVTGASSGIGQVTAVVAAANGLTTVGLDINDKGGRKTEEMAAALGGKVVYIKTDLAQDEEIEAAVEEAAGLGQIKYLANIAGIQHVEALESFPMEKYDLMQRIMLRAPFYLAKLTIPHMKQRKDGRGVIANMASAHAHICTAGKPAYNVTKFGLRGLSQSIAAEGEGRIRSFSVSTAGVSTELLLGQVPAIAEKHGFTEEDVMSKYFTSMQQVKELMKPVDVANLFIFGISRFAKFLDGADLLFDGGMVLTY